MNNYMIEKSLKRHLQSSSSEGSEAFRDELLARCLSLLDSGVSEGCETPECAPLEDDDLEMLAAAGDLSSLAARAPLRESLRSIGLNLE